MFVPSGTMANQIAVGVHTRPGDELLCASTSHVYVWEAGGIARHSGVTARTFEGDFGLLSLDDLKDADPSRRRPLRPDPPGLAREHAQPGRRPDPVAGEHRRDSPLGTREPAGHAPRWRPADERRGGHRQAGPANGPSISTPSRSASRRAWVLRSARRWPARPRRSAMRVPSASCSAGRCGRPVSSPRVRFTRWSTTSSGWPRIMPTPRCWPRRSRTPRASPSSRARSRRTSCGWRVDPALGTAAEVAAYLRSRGILVAALGSQVIRACTHLDVTAR